MAFLLVFTGLLAVEPAVAQDEVALRPALDVYRGAFKVGRKSGADDSALGLVVTSSSISRYERGQLKKLRRLGPLERFASSANGGFYAIAALKHAQDPGSNLTLYNSDGLALWARDGAPSDRTLVANDGRTVVAINGSRRGDLVQFYDENGGLKRSLEGLQVDPQSTGLSPDGRTFVTVRRGARNDGTVSIDDGLVTYTGQGALVWERAEAGLHFAGQLLVLDDRVLASFYADRGDQHYVHIYDRGGTLIKQVAPMVANYGAYRLRSSPNSAFAVAFGHKHVVVFETETGTIRWEWEWQSNRQEDLVQDCLITDDGRMTVAFAYSGKSARSLMVFGATGRMETRNDYEVESQGWGDLQLVHGDGTIVLLDLGSGQNLEFDPQSGN